MRKIIKASKGFTVVELLVVVAIVAILGSLISITFSSTVQGSFSLAPATVSPGTGTDFTYKVTQTWVGSTRPKAGRNVTFRVAPAGTIISVTASGTTNALGEITVTVTPHADYRGGANIWAKDTKSGKEDNPVHFTVQ